MRINTTEEHRSLNIKVYTLKYKSLENNKIYTMVTEDKYKFEDFKSDFEKCTHLKILWSNIKEYTFQEHQIKKTKQKINYLKRMIKKYLSNFEKWKEYNNKLKEEEHYLRFCQDNNNFDKNGEPILRK